MYKSVTSLSPKSLRDLAAALDWHSPEMVARRDLSDESIDELALMLIASRVPTIGWWKRHRQTSSTHPEDVKANHYLAASFTALRVSSENPTSINTLPEWAVR